ncbi:hypothetical protein [Arthrobacter sp. NyZ413]|uniref:hypothetical protein n=1 Tax=Arthrobacter sp. NyZ413 TaxID=3144669 RepID=UPI003BF8AFCB
MNKAEIRPPHKLFRSQDILAGDLVEARKDGVLHFSGEVAEVHPTMDLFWIVRDDGIRRIIEFERFEVNRSHREPDAGKPSMADDRNISYASSAES